MSDAPHTAIKNGLYVNYFLALYIDQTAYAKRQQHTGIRYVFMLEADTPNAARFDVIVFE